MHSSNAAAEASLLRGSLAGLRATVVGLGREGVDLARYLVCQGAIVTVTDSRGASELGTVLAGLEELNLRHAFGGHDPALVLDAEILFVSPGVPPEIPVLQEARARQVPVSSATALLFARCPAPIVGITGSSGKTTTTSLVGRMLGQDGHQVLTGGNIGVPLLNRLEELDDGSLVVLELSSFQLEFMSQSPWVATITNLTPNHLDRHLSMEAYAAAKARILVSQRPNDRAVLNTDDHGSRVFAPRGAQLDFSLERPVRGAFLDGDVLRLDTPYAAGAICATSELRLRGRHNVANVLAAAATSAAAGASLGAVRQVATTFEGVPHRLQLVDEVNGVAYYNDSIATAPERSMAALLSFSEPIVLLAGGRDKHLPMASWAALIRERARHVVMFGEAAELIDSALDAAGYPRAARERASDLDDAVQRASESARPGDVVLLSPGGTSYDMFHDFEERGEAFARAVRARAEARS
ncbi:MAG: UDP-N-acetylmuramoyl-L-alanine--D-glutamate ligase [Chloroflexi bacterium]|nr:UDP-N-acetylmuramoyl-L-alanine--D-glutamate ligase [Chloroflexota bacterium]